MSKFLLSISCFLFCLKLSAQQRIIMDGTITDGLIPLVEVHINNISSEKLTLSDNRGHFKLPLQPGDTLVFSHIAMDDLILMVTENDLKKDILEVIMLQRSTELEEVVVEKRDYALELGIITERIAPPTTYERRLHTAGDFKPIHLLGLLGGSLQLDPIINAINGRTKKLKRNIRVEKRMETLQHIRNNYLEYMVKMFQRPESEIEQFLDYLVEQEGLQSVLASKNQDQMRFYLIDQWYTFQENDE